ncbi:MAG: DNA integrity scanning protein DisA nucleotide-binding domain protein [archaeon]
MKNTKNMEEKLIQIAIKLARRGEGGLFIVITGKKPEFRKLVKQNIKPFNILEGKNDKLIESLATIDGAVVVNKEGKMIAYGTMVKSNIPFRGFGTRHAAALSASRNGNISILSSEEERKVKVFRNGRYIMQLDALEKGIEKNVPRISTFFESVGAGFLGTLGAATLLPGLGITVIPGVIIFGSSYYAIKSLIDKLGGKKK